MENQTISAPSGSSQHLNLQRMTLAVNITWTWNLPDKVNTLQCSHGRTGYQEETSDVRGRVLLLNSAMTNRKHFYLSHDSPREWSLFFRKLLESGKKKSPHFLISKPRTCLFKLVSSFRTSIAPKIFIFFLLSLKRYNERTERTRRVFEGWEKNAMVMWINIKTALRPDVELRRW